MTKYTGAINLTSAYKQNANLPIDDRFVFSTIADRNALELLRRFDGLFAYVEEDNQNYQLQGGIDNANWAIYGSGGKDFIPNVKVLSGSNVDTTTIVAGSQIDGYTLVLNDRVILQRQSDSIDNGVYQLYSDAFRRDEEYLVADSLNEKKFIPENGTYAKRLFFIENSIITVDTDDIIIKEIDYVKTDDFSDLITNINDNSARFNYKDVDFISYETNNSQYTKNDTNNRVDEFQNILGWDKVLNPTLFFKGLSDGRISISYSIEDRTLVSTLTGSGASSIIQSGTGIKQISKGTGNMVGYIKVNSTPSNGEEFDITFTSDSATLSSKSHLVSTRKVEHDPQEGSGFSVIIDGNIFPLDKAKPDYIPVNFDINKNQNDSLSQRLYNTYFLSHKIITGFYSVGTFPGGVHSRDYDGNLIFYVSDADFSAISGYTTNRTVQVVADENYIYAIGTDTSNGSEVRFYQLDHTGTILKWNKTNRHSASIYRCTIGDNQNIYAVEQSMHNYDLFIHRYDFSTNTYHSVQPQSITNLYISLDNSSVPSDYDGKYIELSDSSTDSYFWFNLDGTSVDPAIVGKTGVAVDILSSDNFKMIGSKLTYATISKGFGSLNINGNLYFHYYGPVLSAWTTGNIPISSSAVNISLTSTSIDYSSSSNSLSISFKGSAFLVLKHDGTVGNEFDNSSGKVDILYGLGASSSYGGINTEILSAVFTNPLNTVIDSVGVYWYQYSIQLGGSIFMHKNILGGTSKINFINGRYFSSSDNYNVDSLGTIYYMTENKEIYNVNTGALLYSQSEDDYFIRETYNIYSSLDKSKVYLDGGDKYYILGTGLLPAIYMSSDLGVTANDPKAVNLQSMMYIIPSQLGFKLNGNEKVSFRYLLDQTVPNIGSGSGSGS